MKTTSLSLSLLLALAFSSCVLLASAQDEEWYDPNADYTPDDALMTDSQEGHYLNCNSLDRNYFTLQKLQKCQDPYVFSSRNIQTPNMLAGFLNRACDYAKNKQYNDRYSNIAEYSNTEPYQYTPYKQGQWIAGYDGYPYAFVQTASTTTTTTTKKSKHSPMEDTTPAFLQYKMKEYAAKAAAAAKNEAAVLLETEAKTKTTYPDDGYGPFAGFYTQEDCLNYYVWDPAFRGPVTDADFESLVAFDILLIMNYNQEYDVRDRCNQVELPMFLRYGHFPGNGVTDNNYAKQHYFTHTFNLWYENWVYYKFDGMCWYF